MTYLPDFIVIGAAKAGTTTLWSWLRSVDGCFLPSVKEIEFFSTDRWDDGLDAYASYFDRAGGRVAGEVSPNYMFVPGTAERIASVLPEASIIALLRNPVDRAISQYRHRRRDGVEPLSFADAIAAEPERTGDKRQRMLYGYAARGRYLEQLQPFYERFNRGRILVATFERFITSDESRRDILEFLGLDPAAVNAAGWAHENTAAEPRLQGVHDMLRAGGGRLRELLRETRLRGPLSRLKARLIRANLRPFQEDLEPDPHIRARLAAEFEPQLPALEALTGLDLTPWRKAWRQ